MPTVLPASAINRLKCMETKKTWEKTFRRLPHTLALALPIPKDKQLSQPTPARIIIRYAARGCYGSHY